MARARNKIPARPRFSAPDNTPRRSWLIRGESEKYRLKREALGSQVNEEAQKAQATEQLRKDIEAELAALEKEHADLFAEIADIEKKIEEEEDAIAALRDKKEELVSSTKKEHSREKEALEATRKETEEAQRMLHDLQGAVTDLALFAQKEKHARTRWENEERELALLLAKKDAVLKENESVAAHIEARTRELQAKADEVEYTKNETTKLWGNLHQYAEQVRQATEQLNAAFKRKGYPIHYEIPPEDLTVVPFPRRRK